MKICTLNHPSPWIQGTKSYVSGAFAASIGAQKQQVLQKNKKMSLSLLRSHFTLLHENLI